MGTMETINMMMILVFIISVYQSSLISATTGKDDIKTMIMEMKTTIAMQDEKIAMQDEKIIQNKKDISNLNKKNQQFEELIAEMKLENHHQQKEQKKVVAMLQKENLLNQEKLTLLEVDSKKFKEGQTKKMTSLVEDMNSMMSLEHETSIKVTTKVPPE